MTGGPHMRGYTLLEMIVSVAIFSLVMLAATGAYLTLISLDRQARATNDVVANLAFAVDSMSRAVKTGTGYKCNNVSNNNCTSLGSPGTSFGFTDSESPGRAIVYSLSGGQIMQSVNGTTYPLTDPRISVTKLSFFVRGVGTSGESPAVQPQVTFVIQGRMSLGSSANASTTFSIESGGTERLLELP